MKVSKLGHRYIIDHLDGEENQSIQFVDRGHGHDEQGTTNQELLRVLIDRVKFLDEELYHPVNEHIIHHLRMALVLHEARHLERCVEKGDILPEFVKVFKENGHFALRFNDDITSDQN